MAPEVDRQRRWPHSKPRWRSVPTLVGLIDSQPRSPARWGKTDLWRQPAHGLVASLESGPAWPVRPYSPDAALLHQVIAGHDLRGDSTSIDQPVPDVASAAQSLEIKGMKVGVVSELDGEGYAPGVEQRFGEAVELLSSLGAEIVEVPCPHFVYALPAYYLILPAECSSNLAKFDAMRFGLRVGDDGVASAEQVMAATREAGFGAEVKRRIIIGTYALSSGYYEAYYGQAQKVRTLISRDFDKAFSTG